MANTPSDDSRSGASTPNPRFTSQAHSAEDLLKQQTVGLVHLSDFRKRRADILEQGHNVPQDGTPLASGATTPDGREPAVKAASKKRKKSAKKAVLSFGNDEDEGDNVEPNNGGVRVKSTTPAPAPTKDSDVPSDTGPALKKRLKPNATVSFQPKAVTKSALLRETQLKEQLRKEYMQLQEAVKQTEFCLPFVFFDGKNAPGGMCRIKKGDFIWLFLEQARKVGAGIGGARMKDWARIGVDDLMVVRGDLIIPHHYDFHHFLVNRTVGYDNTPIFNYSAEPTSATPKHLLQKDSNPDSNRSIPQPDDSSHITTAAELARQRQVATESRIPDSELEGFSDDPALTRVVDRRWYERNKHIYPASVWEDLDPTKDYSKDARKDVQGNAFFFSR